MFNYGQINSPRSRRTIQDQSSAGSSQRAQNTCSAQQRLWHPCHPNYDLETAGLGRTANAIQRSNNFGLVCPRSGRNRSPLISTDWSAKGGKRLPQKKITDELVGDRRRLIDPAHARLSIYQQCELLGLSRSTYYYQPIGESTENLALMARIDKFFTDRPELGVRRMHQELTSVDKPLNVKRIRRVRRLMGVEDVYSKTKWIKWMEGDKI